MARPRIRLYHIPGWRSTRVLWMFYELEALYKQNPSFPELDLELLDPDTFRVAKPAEFLALNPNGKIPVLIDGEVIMFDGCAICNYLLER